MKPISNSIKKSFLFLSIFLAGNSCIVVSGSSISNRLYLFEIEYVNYAQGYQHSGIYIDHAGNIFSYEYTSDDEKWKPKSSERFTKNELEEKYSHSRNFIAKIDKDTLQEKIELIPLAAKGSYSDTTNVGADMGKLSYIAYLYNAENGAYIPVILEEQGDWEYKNESEAARILSDWLKTISYDRDYTL